MEPHVVKLRLWPSGTTGGGHNGFISWSPGPTARTYNHGFWPYTGSKPADGDQVGWNTTVWWIPLYLYSGSGMVSLGVARGC